MELGLYSLPVRFVVRGFQKGREGRKGNVGGEVSCDLKSLVFSGKIIAAQNKIWNSLQLDLNAWC